MWWNTVTHEWESEGETGKWSGYPVLFTLHRNTVYPALLPLMRTPRLPGVDWTVASTLHTTPKHSVSSITTVDAHTSAASSRLNLRSCRFKWTRSFRRKTKSDFCAYAITFQTQSTYVCFLLSPFKRSERHVHTIGETKLVSCSYLRVPLDSHWREYTEVTS
jgi:hypothetical protein